MQILFSAILGLALWNPFNFSFTLPNLFPKTPPKPIVVSPQPIPTFTPFPTPQPTLKPTSTPSIKPSPIPTTKPSLKPSIKPTIKPIQKPTSKPKPSLTPTKPSTTTSFTTQQVLSALNNYRSKNGKQPLQLDSKLQDYSQTRTNYLRQIGKLDQHAGFNDFIQNQNGFTTLGFNALAENQGWNYQGNATGLIEDFYAKSPGHNSNQLNSEYTHIGIGISGAYNTIIFGGSKKK